MAQLKFNIKKDADEEMDEDTKQFSLTLQSSHMKTTVSNRAYPAKPSDPQNVKEQYGVKLKKEVFLKFFSILKLAGQGLIKVNDKESIEMEYTVEKCPYLSLVLETGARSQGLD